MNYGWREGGREVVGRRCLSLRDVAEGIRYVCLPGCNVTGPRGGLSFETPRPGVCDDGAAA